jgi:hypothetical protein
MRSGAEEISWGQLMYGIMRVYEFIIGKFQEQQLVVNRSYSKPSSAICFKSLIGKLIWYLEFQEDYIISLHFIELRDAGQVQPNIKAQQSIHFVLGNDYSFKMWDRPFKLVSELYYKSFDVNTYTIDNVRIRYAASNVAKLIQGLDLRLNGSLCQEQNHG